jgi:hypothetical protein
MKHIAPECQLGYPETQLMEMLGPIMDSFMYWMRGQTFSACDGKRYNYETNKYEDTGCGPHGYVFYTHDVERFFSELSVFDS